MDFLQELESIPRKIENLISPPAPTPPETAIRIDDNGNWWAGYVRADSVFVALEQVFNPASGGVPGHVYVMGPRGSDGLLTLGPDLGVKTAAGAGGVATTAVVDSGISNGALAAIGVGSVLAIGLAAWGLSKQNEPGGAMASDSDLQIRKGDRIRITVRGTRVSGTVRTATNYGGRDGWYIELTTDAGGYGYWKQGPDGGTVELLS